MSASQVVDYRNEFLPIVTKFGFCLLISKFLKNYLLCLAVLSVYQKSEVAGEGAELETVFELPCRCWKSNLGPREQQPVLLRAESFLQPPAFCF